MQRRLLIAGTALAGSALAAAAEAREASEIRSLIDRFAASLSARDMTAFAALFADDYVNHQMSAAAPAPPPGGTAARRHAGPAGHPGDDDGFGQQSGGQLHLRRHPWRDLLRDSRNRADASLHVVQHIPCSQRCVC